MASIHNVVPLKKDSDKRTRNQIRNPRIDNSCTRGKDGLRAVGNSLFDAPVVAGGRGLGDGDIVEVAGVPVGWLAKKMNICGDQILGAVWATERQASIGGVGGRGRDVGDPDTFRADQLLLDHVVRDGGDAVCVGRVGRHCV